jgi:two-component system phosphate regulon sensor histidine kinase PhoR
LTGGIFRKLMAGVVGMFLLALASLEFLHSGILWGVAVAFVAATVLAALLARSLARGFAAVLGDAGETAEKLRKTVEQLQRERSEIERVERVRKDFVINVSHELRTPLASIQGYAETLMDGALNDPQYNMRFLGIIRHNAERLARITQDLLTLSRVEQKRQKFDFEPFSVNGLLKQAIELMRPIAEKREIRLELQPGPADACVWCDSEAVSQILSNLLDNAIKYTHAGGRITVGAEPQGRFVELFVRDTGIGISAEELPRVFERFYRVDKARSRELGGTGLGLSIVKHLVGAHSGTTRVESRAGEGSTFFFTLPVDESALSHEQLNPEFTTP